MAIPADLKLDVRVRDRLLARGLVTQAEIDKHVSALPDLDAQATELTLKQPALQKESDRDIVIVKTSGVRPPIAPIVREDDLPIPDDDDDDDDLDDDDAKVLKAAKKAERVSPAAEPVDAEAPAADKSEEADDDDWDDEEGEGEGKAEDDG
jgi:TATA-binding protein-associated factor Taf7